MLRHLKQQGSINPMTAIREYGIYRLAAVVHLLKKEGHNIITEKVSSKNRYGEMTHYAIYKLAGNNFFQTKPSSADDYRRATGG